MLEEATEGAQGGGGARGETCPTACPLPCPPGCPERRQGCRAGKRAPRRAGSSLVISRQSLPNQPLAIRASSAALSRATCSSRTQPLNRNQYRSMGWLQNFARPLLRLALAEATTPEPTAGCRDFRNCGSEKPRAKACVAHPNARRRWTACEVSPPPTKSFVLRPTAMRRAG